MTGHFLSPVSLRTNGLSKIEHEDGIQMGFTLIRCPSARRRAKAILNAPGILIEIFVRFITIYIEQ